MPLKLSVMKQIEQMIKKILRHWFSQWRRLGVLSIKTRDDTKHNRTWVENKALLRHVGGYYFVCQTYVSFLQYTCNTKRIDKCRRQYSVWVQVKRKLWKHPPDMKKKYPRSMSSIMCWERFEYTNREFNIQYSFLIH